MARPHLHVEYSLLVLINFGRDCRILDVGVDEQNRKNSKLKSGYIHPEIRKRSLLQEM